MTTALTDCRGYALMLAEDEAPAPTLYLYDILGVDLFGGIAARQVIDDLHALGEVPELNVRINSPGGDVFEGIAVYNALVRFPAHVTIYVDGLAASIASLIAMAGDRTVVAENAMLMVHPPWTVVMGNAEEMRHQADTLDKAWSAMLTTYARRTGRRGATVSKRVAEAGGEWWMTAGEAVSERFADEVEKGAKKAQVFGLSRFNRVPERLAASSEDDGLVLPDQPRVAEIEAPRVTIEPPGSGSSSAKRQRVLEVLRLAT